MASNPVSPTVWKTPFGTFKAGQSLICLANDKPMFTVESVRQVSKVRYELRVRRADQPDFPAACWALDINFWRCYDWCGKDPEPKSLKVVYKLPTVKQGVRPIWRGAKKRARK